MLFRTRKRSPRIGIGSSIKSAILEVRGERVHFGLPVPSEILIRREAAELSERIEAEQLPPRDMRKLIEDALSNGRPLGEVEDYLDWLENTNDHRLPKKENVFYHFPFRVVELQWWKGSGVIDRRFPTKSSDD